MSDYASHSCFNNSSADGRSLGFVYKQESKKSIHFLEIPAGYSGLIPFDILFNRTSLKSYRE